MWLFAVLFTTLTGAAVSQCYGLNRQNGTKWDKLIRLETNPLPVGKVSNLTCIYGTLKSHTSHPTTKANCSVNNAAEAYDDDNSTYITEAAEYPTCEFGKIDCEQLSKSGLIGFDFGSAPVDNNTMPWIDDGETECYGKWNFSKFEFPARNCSPEYKVEGSYMKVTHKIKPQITGVNSGNGDDTIIYSSPSVIITTTCRIPITESYTVLAWKSAAEDVAKPASADTTIEFTFDLLSNPDVQDDSGRYVVVVGEDISFRINWAAANSAGMKFQLKSLTLLTANLDARKNFEIVSEGCAKPWFQFIADNTEIGDDAYEFSLKSFSLNSGTGGFDMNGVEFDLVAVVKLCDPTDCNALTCNNDETAVNTNAEVSRKRSTDLSHNLEEIQLSTGPFVLLSKEQISGAKAVGLMLPLSIFNVLLFLQYL